MRVHIFEFEGASVQLSALEPGVYLVRDLYSRDRRQGHAKNVMQQVIEFADANRFDLILTVQRFGKTSPEDLNNSQLESFYSKFGFVRHPKYLKLPVRMIRYHSQELHAV